MVINGAPLTIQPCHHARHFFIHFVTVPFFFFFFHFWLHPKKGIPSYFLLSLNKSFKRTVKVFRFSSKDIDFMCFGSLTAFSRVCDLEPIEIDRDTTQVFEAASLSISWSSICRWKLPAHAQPSYEILLLILFGFYFFISWKSGRADPAERHRERVKKKFFHATASAVADGMKGLVYYIAGWHDASRWSVTSQPWLSSYHHTTWLPWPAPVFQPSPEG